MKNFIRILSAVICLIMMVNCFAACGIMQGQDLDTTDTDGSEHSESNEGSGTESEKDTTNGASEEDPTESGTSSVIDPQETLYTLLYKGGEGAEGMAPTAVRAAAGEKITLSENTFIRSGYTFAGWSDGKAGYAPGDEFTMPASNVDMTAQWQEDAREQITVTFNAMGGASIGSMTVGKGEDVSLIALPQAYKEGYVFSEWFIDEGLTASFYDNMERIDEAITLYAAYFEIERKGASYLSTGESSLTSQDPNTVIMIDSFGVELTQQNYTEYIKITNNYEIKETPSITLEQSGDLYLLKADPAWPKGGNFYIEAKEPVKIIIETENVDGDKVELALSKLFFTVHVGENSVELKEKSHIIPIACDKYFAFTEDALYLNTDFAFDSEIAVGRILKVFDENGDYEYVKVGATASEDFGGISAFVVRTTAPSLNEIYNEFKLTYTEDNINSAEYVKSIDEQEVVDTLTYSQGFQQIQNLSTAMVADFAVMQGFADVGGIELLDGTTIMSARESKNDLYNPIAYIDLSRCEYGVDEKGNIFGTWFVVMRGRNQYGKVHISFGTYTDMWISADGDCDIDVDVNLPWDDKFVDVNANIWFDVYLGHRQEISFTFDIIYYNDGVEYDVRKHFEENDPYDYPDNFAEKYKELINMGNRDVPIFSIDLFIFRIDILNLINVKIPIGVELTMSVNGSFSVHTESTTVKYYGLKGDIHEGFEAYSGETYCSTDTTLYYNGTFGVKAGVYVAVEFSVLGLGKIGCIGLEIGFGVFYNFYGYGYTSTWYRKESADSKFETEVTEQKGSLDVGAVFSQFGVYFSISIYAKSEVFKVKVELEHVFEIPLVEIGDKYLLLGFTEEIKELARKGIIFDDNGFNIQDLGLHYYEYLDVETGDVVTRICANIPDGMPISPRTLAKYGGEFSIELDKAHLEPNYDTGDIGIRSRYKGTRFDTELTLVGYIGGDRVENDINKISIEIPLYYVPESLELDPDRLDETVHVTFKVGDLIYYETDIPYGYSISSWHISHPTPEIGVILSSGASDDFYAENPQYTDITWNRGVFKKILKEDLEISASYLEEYVKVSFNYIIASSNGAPIWCSEQKTVPVHTKLYDIIPDITDPSDCIIIDQDKPWNAENKVLSLADEGLEVTAQYEYLPVTLTVKVDAYESDKVSVPEETFTYALNAGDSIFDQIYGHFAIFYKTYSGYGPNGYGTWWTAYVKEGEIFTNTQIWRDETYHIGWTTQELNVEVYDHQGNVVVSREVRALSDQSDILEEEAVKNIVKTYRDENGITWEFKGWVNKHQLNRVTSYVCLIPAYSRSAHKVKLDPNGGHFDLSMMLGSDGCLNWEILSGDTLELIDGYHDVIREGSDTEAYTFNGWYSLGENGEKIFGFAPVTEDITYYADWVMSEKQWYIKLFANGYSVSGGAATPILGAFSDTGSSEMLFNEDHAKTMELINAINAGDNSVLPVPVANESEYYKFLKWSIAEIDGKGYELYAVYEAVGTTTVIFDLGKGTFNGTTTGVYSFKIEPDMAWSFGPEPGKLNYWEPANLAEGYIRNESTGEWELIEACYEDEYYLYTFKEWLISDDRDIWTYEPGLVITVTAVYERHSKRIATRFSIDKGSEDPECLNGDSSISYYEIYSLYGDTVDTAQLPTVTKTVGNDPYDDSLWHYVFDRWERVDTGEALGNVIKGGEYRAVFKKEFRKVTMTFDAGENAVFPSTGDRFCSVTVNRGTSFGELASTVEPPVRTDGTLYEFIEWGGYADAYIIMFDGTSSALWWNTERKCNEGSEDMIQIILDTGDDSIVFENSATRFHTVMFEQGKTLVDSMSWHDGLAQNEWPVGYLANFVLVKDGERYAGLYDIELPFEMNIEKDRTILKLAELIPYDEWEAMLDAGDAGA